jgi:hypothetical protein
MRKRLAGGKHTPGNQFVSLGANFIKSFLPTVQISNGSDVQISNGNGHGRSLGC